MLAKDTPKLLLAETNPGIIWKLVLDDEHQIMVWEVRDLDKKVFFYAYDFKNSCFLLHRYSFEEKWNVGLMNIYDGIIYFHGYENEFAPTHKGIIAFDLAK